MRMETIGRYWWEGGGGGGGSYKRNRFFTRANGDNWSIGSIGEWDRINLELNNHF